MSPLLLLIMALQNRTMGASRDASISSTLCDKDDLFADDESPIISGSVVCGCVQCALLTSQSAADRVISPPPCASWLAGGRRMLSKRTAIWAFRYTCDTFIVHRCDHELSCVALLQRGSTDHVI
jgi:hypothetical protein